MLSTIVSGDHAVRNGFAERASTLVADLAPFNAGYLRFTKRRKGNALSIVWCAEPGGEPVLFVGYDSTRIGRELVDYIVAARFGVPAEVQEMAL